MSVHNIHVDDFGGPEDVYIGRAGRGQEGYYGNPIRVKDVCPECGNRHMTGVETLVCFEQYARRRIETDRLYRGLVATLHGKRLFCFCAPKPCHGQILERLAAELAG